MHKEHNPRGLSPPPPAPGSATEDPPKMAIRSDKDEPRVLVNKLDDKVNDVTSGKTLI